tara:strand:- start:2869 stop:3093 length:225 start_codon:yes stop_codon:yes gene_type:complete
MSEERKITIDEKDYDFDSLSQEQQILVEHIDTCRRNKSQLMFQIDKESVAEGAFVKMLTESVNKKDDKKEEKDA